MKRRIGGVIAAVCILNITLVWTALTQDTFIRSNQLGSLPGERMNATVLSRHNLQGKRFDLTKNGNSVFHGVVGKSLGSYAAFSFSYHITAPPVDDSGAYAFHVDGESSFPFTVGERRFDGLVDSLLLFFRVQRCGNDAPFLHKPCHLHDATSVISASGTHRGRVDLSGGWHDAGDYVKFLNTTAYASYLLLFADELHREELAANHPAATISPVLQEARVGIRWLRKLRVSADEVVTQVQDLRDHDQGWRLPEDDPLAWDRPAFVGTGKNLIGVLSAVMAFAAKTFEPMDRDFADSCLTFAEDLFSHRNEVPDLDASGSGMYRDLHYQGKLALGAVELYRATGNRRYLNLAKAYADSAGADFWWSWGDINSLADYRLAAFDKRFSAYIRKNLSAANAISRRAVFGEAAPGSWGSVNAMLGVVLQADLWKRLTGDHEFDALAARQCDYIFGENPWGVSFFSNVGAHPARHFHSQIAYFHGGYLPGGLAAGPVPAATLRQYAITDEHADPFAPFQSESAVYHDDRMDYVTNEPTIAAAATAMVVFENRTTGRSVQRAGINEH